MGQAIIDVTGTGIYNVFGTESYLENRNFAIRGGVLNVKIPDLGGGTLTITPQVDYHDNDWAELLVSTGDAVQTITVGGSLNIGPVKTGMRLRFDIAGTYSSTFQIYVLG